MNSSLQIKRILNEQNDLKNNPNPMYTARPMEVN